MQLVAAPVILVVATVVVVVVGVVAMAVKMTVVVCRYICIFIPGMEKTAKVVLSTKQLSLT